MKIFVLILVFAGKAFCEGDSYSFIVKILPSKIMVSSPGEAAKDLSLIIENKTVGPIWGKVVDEDWKVLEYLGIPSQTTRVVTLKNYKKDKNYYFIPQSPPFQKIILEFNKSNYEIPPSKS
jgi:hypothetical protein